MHKSTKAALAYQKQYNAQPEQVNKREANNRARYAALKAGTVRKGDNLQVDHKKPLDAGGKDTPSNRRVVMRSTNEAWRKFHPKMYGGNK